MKKVLNLLFVFMFAVVIANAQDGNKTTSPGDPEVFVTVEEMPQFPGGEEAMNKLLSENLKYPEASKKNKEEGTVFVQFVVDATGKVVNPKVLKGVSADLDAEAMRVVSMMPAWTPGKQSGKAVSVVLTVPVKFTL